MNTNDQIQKTQEAILKHHGGDAEVARGRITQNFEARHDEAFWQHWDANVAKNHQTGETIVDLGAGIGQFVAACGQRYPESKVIGIEVAPYMLREPVALPSNACIEVDDLNEPNEALLPASSVSMVMANMLVHELIQPIKMFKAVRQWLKVGGRLCVIDVVRKPLEDYLQRRYPNTEMWEEHTTRADLEDAFEHFLEHNRYHPHDIIYMLEAGGFKIVAQDTLRNGLLTRLVAEKL